MHKVTRSFEVVTNTVVAQFSFGKWVNAKRLSPHALLREAEGSLSAGVLKPRPIGNALFLFCYIRHNMCKSLIRGLIKAIITLQKGYEWRDSLLWRKIRSSARCSAYYSRLARTDSVSGRSAHRLYARASQGISPPAINTSRARIEKSEKYRPTQTSCWWRTIQKVSLSWFFLLFFYCGWIFV
jgi:hypothetical protein